MSDPLNDLADEILKSKSKPVRRDPAPAQRQAPMQRPEQDQRITKGAGGVIFNFGIWTGNPMADNATRLLQQFGDPVQSQVANDQARAFRKSLHDFVKTGETSDRTKGVHDEWSKQFDKGLDQQVVDAIKKGEISIDDSTGMRTDIKGDFNKSQMRVGNEDVVAQSETDAAVIEMMKAMQTSEDDDEFVIDATRGV